MSAPTGRKMPLQSKMRFAFSIFLLLLFMYTTYEALDFQRLARYLPLAVSMIALLAVSFGLIIDVLAYRRQGVVAADDVPMTAALAGSEVKEHKLQAGKTEQEEVPEGEGTTLTPVTDEGEVIDPADVIIDTDRLGEIEPPSVILKRTGVVALWILGYMDAIAIFGIMLASAGYLVAYLFLQARARWQVPVIGTISILLLMTAMRIGLNLEWPDYLLESTFESLFGFG
jgi:hypothetical protein